VKRSAFFAAALGAVTAGAARAQSIYDPAVTSNQEELRVLLGKGTFSGTEQGFIFNNKAYRGSAMQLPDGNVVNRLSLEEYLYSVVPREMSPSWPAAALQAQAICARTFVLQRSDPRRAYDVTPSELDQVYYGISTESPAGRAAVDASAGLVLKYADAYALVMYSSCCGGHTEASSDAWGGLPFAYLGGVVCTTCVASPYYRWRSELDLDAVARTFAAELAPFGQLRGINEGDRDASGRARTFLLQGDRGSIPVKGSAFRLRIGPRAVPSLLVTKIDTATEATERIAIEGGGLGHGVGLCQWGARGLALNGASFGEILRFYFPGTTVEHV
jgi:stage II sporulation protein D